MIELASDLEELRPRISVIGVGGAGGNAVANMIRSGVRGVDFVVANTDAQALQASPAERIIQLGRATTQGLGAGSSAELGRAAAEESLADIEKMLEGAHMCFIAAGLGGGTGSGAAPVIARAARAKGILTVGVVTKPFAFEGRRRAEAAERGLEALEAQVDTLIVIPNQNLFRIASPATTFKAAFDMADEVLRQGVCGITDLMVMPGLINLDFADIRTIMANMGKAMMGTGEATGDNRAMRAAEQAIANPLLDEALKGARGLIISISGGDDMLLMEVDEAAGHIKALVDPDADIIWGSASDPALDGRIRVSVVATGIDARAETPASALAGLAVAASPVLVKIADGPIIAPIIAPLFGPAPPPGFASAATPILFEMPEQAALPLEPPMAPFDGGMTDGELLLTVERALTLAPPEGADDFVTVEPFAANVEMPRAFVLPVRGPSLFERMAMLARGATEVPAPKAYPALPHLRRSGEFAPQRIARAA
ncbi:MAG TPA: cell division protein FtsZ [Allosphingosinicella sp.]|nr:cell division protein FtsZ [Allosphingosinicella sp.]